MHFRCLYYYYLAALQYYIDVAYCHRWSNVVSLYVSRSVCHDCNNNKQQPFYGPLSGTTWVSRTRVSQYQKKHSPTRHPDHLPIFISFFHLPPSIASSLFKLRAWQSFCTTSLHILWSTSWSGALHLIFHTFLHPISVFFSFCPYHRNMFCCSINIISSIPSLCLNSLLGTLSFYLNITHPSDHSHLCSL